MKVVQKIKIHILFSATFSENRAVYEIMSKNVVQRKRPQMAKLRRVACWISKATRALAHASIREHTHTEICKTYCFSTAAMISEKRLSVTFIRTFLLLLFIAK